jgi:hypothetical protein
VIGAWELSGNQSGCWSTKFCYDVLGRRVWLGRRQGKGGKGLETLVIACGHMTNGSSGAGNTKIMYYCVMPVKGRELWNCMRRVAVPWDGRKYVETKEVWQSPGERVRD